MSILSRLTLKQRGQGPLDVATGLQGLGGSPAALSQDRVGGGVVGDGLQGGRSCERIAGQELVALSGLLHAPENAAPARRGATRKDCGKSAQPCTPPADAHERRLSKLLIAYWRRKHPKKTAEHLAAKHRVSVRVAYEWLAGKLPTIRHFATMAATEGKDFVKDVLHRLADYNDGRLRLRLRFRRRQTQGA